MAEAQYQVGICRVQFVGTRAQQYDRMALEPVRAGEGATALPVPPLAGVDVGCFLARVTLVRHHSS